MILNINFYAFAYTCYFLAYFLLAFSTINATRFEELFKQGKVWQIRVSQVIISFIIAWLLAQGTKSLVEAFVV